MFDLNDKVWIVKTFYTTHKCDKCKMINPFVSGQFKKKAVRGEVFGIHTYKTETVNSRSYNVDVNGELFYSVVNVYKTKREAEKHNV